MTTPTFLKDAMQYLLSLKTPETVEVDGRQYSTGSLSPILAPLPPGIVVHSLSGLADYINKNEDDLPALSALMLIVESPEKVVLLAHHEGAFAQRRHCATATMLHEGFKFGNYYPQEEFCIALLTRFVQDDNRDAVLSLVGALSSHTEIQLADDGFSQKVTINTGIIRKENVPVTNPIELRPYRTFIEVEQAPCQLVLRMRKGKDSAPECALFEADGGLWKTLAAKNVATWLQANVPKDVKVLA